jgi:integrase
MKGKREHRIPLSGRAIQILRGLDQRGDRIFPLHGTAMLDLMRELRPGYVPHGLRSTFRDWAAETTNYPNHVVEQALAHAIPSAVEAAYRRGDMFEKRRRLMDAWSQHCARPHPAAGSGSVVPLRSGTDA